MYPSVCINRLWTSSKNAEMEFLSIISTISREEQVTIITEHLLPHMIAVVQSVSLHQLADIQVSE